MKYPSSSAFMRFIGPLLLISATAFGQSSNLLPRDEGWTLSVVAESDRQWTGVAVSESGRIFVNFPRWSEDVPVSVGELQPDGSIKPYPNKAWNKYKPSGNPSKQFVCVQSVYVADGLLFDKDGNLYLSALEANAIHRLNKQGALEVVVQDERIQWPDSFSQGPDGSIYFTTSQIHYWGNPPDPYRIFKLERASE